MRTGQVGPRVALVMSLLLFFPLPWMTGAGAADERDDDTAAITSMWNCPERLTRFIATESQRHDLARPCLRLWWQAGCLLSSAVCTAVQSGEND